jgi:CDP-glycerol glycerophosphotransferase (TagB/SpsB family)
MNNRYLFFVSELYALGILRPLQQVIRARGDEAAWFFDGPGANWLKADEREIKTVDEVKAYRPAAVFVPGNWVPHFFPGVKVEVFHGFSVHKRSPERGHFRIRGFFDLYCTQGPDTTVRFQQLAAQHRYFRVVETGWPKMDPLFKASPPARKTPAGKPVVLYASTFTPSLSSAPHLYREIEALSRRGARHWLVTLHPKTDRQWRAQYRRLENQNLEFIETDDIVPILKAADVMVSDTSSVMAEFMLQRRPVVAFRNRRQDANLLNITEPCELDAALDKALSRPPALMDALRAYGDRIQPWRDGRSSERILAAVDAFIADGGRGLRNKPSNLFRKLKARFRLGYYRDWTGRA